MSEMTRRSGASLLDLVDWMEGWPVSGRWPVMAPAVQMRVEEMVRDGAYVIRAEIPGIDPDKDLEVTVADGTITIAAERREEIAEKHRSEFRYGSHVRRLPLPKGVVADDVTASYEDGILTLTMPLPATTTEPRTVPVTKAAG